MTSSAEQQLRDLFAAEAEVAPEAVGLTEGAQRRARHRRRVQTAWASGVVGVIAVAAGVLVTAGPGQQPHRPPLAAPAHPTTQAALPSAEAGDGPILQGPVPFGGAESSVEVYSPAAVAGRAFAFDGTVTAIGSSLSNPAGGPPDLVGVTFRVNKWFRGGTGDTMTVDWYPPGSYNSATNPSLTSYGIGSRLLVSGEPSLSGDAPDTPIAWTCGFTRYYDPQTAAEWATATR
jgi:hypothetical protein